MSLWSLIIAWAVYLSLHSMLATAHVKNFCYANGFSVRGFRLSYSLFATVSLIPVLIIMGASDKSPVFPLTKHVSSYFGLILATFGILVGRLAFRHQPMVVFLGIKEAPDSSSEKLTTDGIYSKIRHPLYSGMILVLLGLVVYVNTLAALASTLCILVYFPLGIFLEEKKLITQYGEAYLRYRKKVKALIPKIL